MRKLTVSEIERLARRKRVKRIAIENFLMSMGTITGEALFNLSMDAELYRWNKPTIRACQDGIRLASVEMKGGQVK